MDVFNSLLQSVEPCTSTRAPLICFSHLRWDFVLQRPQHLMRRFSQDRQVFFFEEFIPTDHHLAYLEIHPFEGTTTKAIRPRIPHWWSEVEREKALGKLLDDLIALHGGHRPVLWFYTPMMFAFSRHVDAAAVIYDCMDELANFRFAPPRLKETEDALIARADVVFTGGASLYEAKKHRHDNIHAFPSSVDAHHFRKARDIQSEPSDQAAIPHPRLGYYGVIDERLDLDLIHEAAAARPDFSFVFLGPVVKISAADLPQAANIHYLGQKAYADLPAYLSGWQAAIMPFALNEATRFISPTKTPEYLAAGRPVVSTRIADVVRTYSDVAGLFLADGAEQFAKACDAAITLSRSGDAWKSEVDELLSRSSWNATFSSMSLLVEQAVAVRFDPPAVLKDASFSFHRRGLRRAYDYLVVGAGFSGSVMAERLASDGHSVLVCDRRPHIAGKPNPFRDRRRAGRLHAGLCRSPEGAGTTARTRGETAVSRRPEGCSGPSIGFRHLRLAVAW